MAKASKKPVTKPKATTKGATTKGATTKGATTKGATAKGTTAKGTTAKGTTAKGTTAKVVTKKAPTSSKKIIPISDELRYQMIAEAAFYNSQKRTQLGGDSLQDWLLAEKQIEQQLNH